MLSDRVKALVKILERNRFEFFHKSKSKSLYYKRGDHIVRISWHMPNLTKNKIHLWLDLKNDSPTLRKKLLEFLESIRTTN